MKPKKNLVWSLPPAARFRLGILASLLIGLGIGTGLLFSSHPSPQDLDRKIALLEAIFQQGNYLEARLWGLFALGFSITALRNPGDRNRRFLAAAVFFLFGLSDLVEVQTGAWWHPWWLFGWKALCVITMFILFLHYLQTRSNSPL